jgi:hypothetical protein
MNRVSEIIRLEKLAAGNDTKASEIWWEAAYLIWQEIQAGKQQKVLAEEIGKSRTHVCWMNKCWELASIMVARPPFMEMYHSAEVRGESAMIDQTGAGRKPREVDDHSGHGLVSKAAEALGELSANPAYWPLMTEDDWTVIRELIPVIRSLLRDSGR